MEHGRKRGAGALGDLELEVSIRDAATGAETRTVSTVSMWVTADEWVGTLDAKRAHAADWRALKLESAIHLQCCIAEGLMPDTPLSLMAIGEMLNRFDVETVAAGGAGGGAEDPSRDDQEGDPEAG